MVFITLQKITGKYIEIIMPFSLFVCNLFFFLNNDVLKTLIVLIVNGFVMFIVS